MKKSNLKLQVLSDLHLEFLGPPSLNKVVKKRVNKFHNKNADVLVLAGDITSSKYLQETMTIFCDLWPEVVFCCGNHEYYNSSILKVNEKLEGLNSKVSNFHWLYNSTVQIGKQRFIGSTLWFPETEDSTNKYLQGCLYDTVMIKDFSRAFSEHNKAYKYLKNNIKETDVVVTHHFPHKKSIHKKYANNLLNCFFYAGCDNLVEINQPKLYIHGHTHSSFNYFIDKTRVLCNPCGYRGVKVENTIFDEHLMVEVGAVDV